MLGVGTTRTGWLGALRLTGSFFDESANLTLVRATYNDNGSAVAYVPGVVFRSDTRPLSTPCPGRCSGKPIRTTLGAGITYVGPAPAALRRGERHDLHHRRLGVGGMGELPASLRRDQPPRYAIPPGRIQLRLRLPQPAAADAGAGARPSRPARRAPCS